MHENRAGVCTHLCMVIAVSCEPRPLGFLAFPSQEKIKRGRTPKPGQSSLEPLLQQWGREQATGPSAPPRGAGQAGPNVTSFVGVGGRVQGSG